MFLMELRQPCQLRRPPTMQARCQLTGNSNALECVCITLRSFQGGTTFTEECMLKIVSATFSCCDEGSLAAILWTCLHVQIA